MPRHAALLATGLYLPEREISNDLLREWFPEPADLISKLEASTGIRRRFWAPEDWAASDLAVRAAARALQAAGREPQEVDLIILGTDSPDYPSRRTAPTPSTGGSSPAAPPSRRARSRSAPAAPACSSSSATRRRSTSP
jgi:3-oxoacyl-[acyl-carrier-protein] synthase III